MYLFLMSTTHGRPARSCAFAQILLLLFACLGYKAEEAVATVITDRNPTSTLFVATPEANSPPSNTNVFGTQLRRRSKTESKDSQSIDKTPSPKPQEARPASNSLPKTPTPTSAPSPSSYVPKSKEPLILKATGNTMTLGGVDQLDKNSLLAWGNVTGNFIRSDIKNSLKNLDQLEVSVLLVSQEPPVDEVSGRALMKSEARRMQVNEQKLTFDVDILIQSIVEVQDANKFVANAFNSEAKQTSYLQMLRATGYSSFADVETISVNVRQSSSKPSKNEIMAIGIMAASMLVAIIFFSIILFVLHRKRAHATQHVVKTEDPTVQVRTDTESNSSFNDKANGPSDEEQSHASNYWQGGIHVSLSSDTDLQSTPRVSHLRLLITKSESSIDVNSLFTEDGFDRHMYTTGKTSTSGRRFEM